jgi:uncharacterized protein involved in outer membrane biogenesis
MKRFRKILLCTIGTLFALFLALSAVVYWAILRDENQIKQIVISELNKSLTGEVSVERMNFTFWSSFPYIALDFGNIKAMGANRKDSVPLLEAKRLSLNFNLRDIWAKKYEVKQIDLRGANVWIKLYANGTGNYDIWKSTSSDTVSDFSFALKKIRFKNTQINFINEPAEQYYEVYIHDADAKGDFSTNLYNIALSGDLELELLQSRQAIILAKKSMLLQTQLTIDNETETLHCLDGSIRLENLDFNLS